MTSLISSVASGSNDVVVGATNSEALRKPKKVVVTAAQSVRRSWLQ